MKVIVLFLTSLVALVTCNGPLGEFAEGNRLFSARLYNEVLKENPDKNFIFSPFSIEVILALTRAGAKGKTASEFTSALNLPSEKVTEDALKELLPKLKNQDEDLKLLSANKMYLGKDFQIQDTFKSLATGTFNADTENVDFSKKQEAVNIINKWVEQQTNNKIKDLVKPDSVDVTTRLILVNALYFFGKWLTPFNEHTVKSDFHISSTKTKKVDMMYVEDSFRYHESSKLNAKFLELPYLGGNVSMVIVLPNKVDGLGALENNLEEVLAPQNLQYTRVSVHMPSFLIETDLKLKPILQKLGLKTIFSDGADLSGISKEPLVVDDVVQKAFINVTTSGTEAAAATYVQGVLLSAAYPIEDPIEFIADHPFVYYIKRNNVVLFLGKSTK